MYAPGRADDAVLDAVGGRVRPVVLDVALLRVPPCVPLPGDNRRFVENLWMNCVILKFYPQKNFVLHDFTVAAEDLMVDYVFCGFRVFVLGSHTGRETFGRNGPRTRKL